MNEKSINHSLQVGWKSLILDFMERYFYLICFAAYALEHGPNNYQKSFKSWMDDHNELRQSDDLIFLGRAMNHFDFLQVHD